MADALASGASEGNLVGVQVPPRPLCDVAAGKGVAWSCFHRGMPRTRIDTTVDEDLLAQVRGRHVGATHTPSWCSRKTPPFPV